MQKHKMMFLMMLTVSFLPGVVLAHQAQLTVKQQTKKIHKDAESAARRPAKHNKPAVSARTSQDAGVGGRIGPVPEINWEVPDTAKLVQTGKEAAKRGAWQEARSDYQRVLDIEPSNQEATYGIAECAGVAGDVRSEIKYFRTAIYAHNPSGFGTVLGDGFRENMPDKLMAYVLLLSRTGQDQEALFVYRRAADLLNYEQGRPVLKVLLPEVVAERTLPAQVRYTPERLQALAETAIAHEEMAFGSNKEALAYMQEAVKLYPDSPVTHYYLGEELLRTNGLGAKAAYQKAVQLGDNQTIAAAKERILSLP